MMPAIRTLVGLWLWAWLSLSQGADLIMARSILPFPETMAFAQEQLAGAGYTISHIQRVDVGLQAAGYASDKYQILMFGNKQEMDLLQKRYPDIIAYLPWKLTLFAEENQTLVVGIHPQTLVEMFPELKTERALKRLEQTLDQLFVQLRQLR